MTMTRTEKLIPGWTCDKTNGGMDFCIRATYYKCPLRIEGLTRKQVEQVDKMLRYVSRGAIDATRQDLREALGIKQEPES